MNARAEEILRFWLGDADVTPVTVAAMQGRVRVWFQRDAAVDREIGERFGEDVARAAEGALDAWADDPRGLLALLVLLDQFPRNLHRDSARAFEQDARARSFAEQGIERGFERQYNEAQRFVLYLPLMHAEDLAAQRVCVAKFREMREQAASPELQSFMAAPCGAAERHAWIVEQFGRYPHRNKVLGRETTPEEAEFLTQPNSSF